MVERPVGSGIWRLRVYVGRHPVTGNPIQAHRTFKGSERAAGRELAKLVTEVEARAFDRTKTNVGELLDKWLEHIEAVGKACPKTLYEYRRKIEGRLRPAVGTVRLAKLDADTIDAWYRRWLDEGLSPSTVRIYHSILNAACQQAVRWGWLERAPTERASAPTPKSPTMRVPTPVQLSALLRVAERDDPVLATAVALAALTGARRGELVALRWSNIDLEAGLVRIERGVTVVEGMAIEGPTKTHQARRVALDEIGIHTLQRHWLFIVNRSRDAESPLVEDPYVLSYAAHSGIRVNGDTLTHRLASLCRRVEKAATREGGAPVERYGFHFHELRHFSVTTLLAAGVDVRTVAERHGHAQATMTLNRYTRALPERHRVAASVLGKAFASG
jgi:integrase